MRKFLLISILTFTCLSLTSCKQDLRKDFTSKFLKSIKSENFEHIRSLLPNEEDKSTLTDSCLASLHKEYPVPDSVLVPVLNRKFDSYQKRMIEEAEPTFNRLLKSLREEKINLESITIDRTDFDVGWRDCLYQGKIIIHISTDKGPYQIYLPECIKSNRTWLLGERIYLKKEE